MNKKLLFALAGILIVALGAYFYLKDNKLDDFEPAIKNKLQQLVKEGSNGLYTLNVEKITADVVNSRVVLSQVTLTYDSLVYQQLRQQQTAPADVFKISVEALAVDGITPNDLISKKNISLNIIYADKPVVNLYHHEVPEKGGNDSVSLYQRIQNELGSFKLNRLSLNQIDFTYHRVGQKVQTAFKDLNAEFKDILIDESTQYDTTRFMYARDASMGLKDFVHKTADSLYIFRMDSISVQAASNQVSIQKLQLNPRHSKAAFRKAVKYRQDRYDLSVSNVQLEQVDWWRFLAGEGLFVENATIRSGHIEIYSDKGIPPRKTKRVGDYPHQKLFKSETPMHIENIKVSNLDVAYAELNVKTGKEGRLLFQQTSATISNVTNIAGYIKNNGTLRIDALSKFMNAGALKAGFIFNLARQKEGVFSVYADLGPMDGTLINRATRPLASVEISRAQIKRYKASIDGDNYRATGKIFLTYSDLKIAALKKGDDGEMDKRGLVSFLANNFKINRDYPKEGKQAETFSTSYQRPLDRSFFALIWKTMLPGIKEAVGI